MMGMYRWTKWAKMLNSMREGFSLINFQTFLDHRVIIVDDTTVVTLRNIAHTTYHLAFKFLKHFSTGSKVTE